MRSFDFFRLCGSFRLRFVFGFFGFYRRSFVHRLFGLIRLCKVCFACGCLRPFDFVGFFAGLLRFVEFDRFFNLGFRGSFGFS